MADSAGWRAPGDPRSFTWPTWLPTVSNRGTVRPMRTSHTLGFAVEDKDRPRLERLTNRFGDGNRSAFLRRAMDVMERIEIADELVQLQAYGAQRLELSGRSRADIPQIVAAALANPSPEAVAEAKLIVAGIQNVPTWDSSLDSQSTFAEDFRAAMEHDRGAS